MARPLNANAEQTQKRLLEVALAAFARHGYDGVSTREICAQARLNVATLNYYFGGKQGLYDAVVNEVYRRLLMRAMAALEALARPAGSQPAAAPAPRRAPAWRVPTPFGPMDLEVLIERLYRIARAEQDGVRILVREVLEHGRLRARTEQAHFLPSLASYGGELARGLGIPVAQARQAWVALSYLLSRYAIQDPESLRAALGTKTIKQAEQRVLDSLVRTARAHLEATP